jgi:hypothetical protein
MGHLISLWKKSSCTGTLDKGCLYTLKISLLNFIDVLEFSKS